MDALAQIFEMTRPTQHLHAYERGSEKVVHRVTAPALLWQLANYHPLASPSDERAGSGFVSRPSARVETMDVLMRIDREASALVRRLGHDDDRDTVGLVRLIGSLLPALGDVQRAEVETLVSRWYTMARITTGWDSPRWRPHNTCPACQARGSLRIRLEDLDAFCAECHATWDRAVIGVLAEHLRQENGETQTGEGMASTG